jgi:hypothetical protein
MVGPDAKRSRTVRGKQPQKEEAHEEIPVDLDALFNQMQEILQEAKVSIPDEMAEEELEAQIFELVRQNTNFGENWQPDHQKECSCQKCTIAELAVHRYGNSKHLCVMVKGIKVCGDPLNAKLHSGPFKDDKNYYLCEESGCVHLCGDMCRASKYLTTHANEYVCPISGMVLGVEMKGEWWTDPEKQAEDMFDEPEMDQDAWEVNHPRLVTHKVYDKDGNVTTTTEYAQKNIIITNHSQYHNHPFEKRYYHYLLRCKDILWLVLYSAKRQQIERQRLLSNYDNMAKAIEKYVRGCEKNKILKGWHEVRCLVRYHMKARTDIPMWIPPLRIEQPFLFRYARIIVKFFWIVLEKTPFGRTSHTQLPFDYFVLATINIMRTRGLAIKGHQILPHDQYLAAYMPDPGLLHHFGIQVNFMTKARNKINQAITDVDPRTLQVTVTDKDSLLFHETKERVTREFAEKQRREQLEAKANGKVRNSPSVGKRKK